MLSVYPTTIRRRILRHLYLERLQSTYLFRGCGQKFLDAVLAASRLELYMPKVRYRDTLPFTLLDSFSQLTKF